MTDAIEEAAIDQGWAEAARLSELARRYKREAEEARANSLRLAQASERLVLVCKKQEAELSYAREALERANTYFEAGDPTLAWEAVQQALSTPQRKGE